MCDLSVHFPEDLSHCKSAGHKDLDRSLEKILNNELVCHCLACSQWHDTLSSVFPTELHCYVSMCFFHVVVFLGELDGSSFVCGKATNGSFAFFGMLIPTHHSLTPKNHFVHRRYFLSWNPSVHFLQKPFNHHQVAMNSPVCPPGTSRTRSLDMRSCSVTHYSFQPTFYFVLDKYDQEAEALLLFPDAFH